ncbi:hypothetical protein V8C42DRAFT_343959 [Trichoderma barbatum]
MSRDHVTYVPDQKEQLINFWDPSNNSDQPRNTTIGPSFWETFTAIEGTKYIFGLNFYKNDSTYLDNLRGQVSQSLLQIPPERLHLFEIGHENDYGALSGFRPPTWTQQDWVEEWIDPYGVNRMHMHQGTGYRYGAWMPIAQNGTGPSTNSPYYGHVTVSKFIGAHPKTRINNHFLNSDFYSAYAAYENERLARVII